MIVDSLPGKPARHYIIAFFANLGYRYADPQFARASTIPCFGRQAVCVTQKIAQLGNLIDTFLAHSSQPTALVRHVRHLPAPSVSAQPVRPPISGPRTGVAN